MELMIALALFIGMIVSWLMLPGSTTTSHAVVQTAPSAEISEERRSTVGQPA
jgi:hypothetical protein